MKLDSRRVINLAVLAVGLGALVLLVREVTLERLLAALQGFGSAFLLVLLMEALSNLTSCLGWWYTFHPEGRPPLPRLLAVTYASLSVAGALPGGQAGEVAKANLLRGHARMSSIVSALLVYNYLHVLTTCGVAVLGALAGLFSAEYAPAVVWVALAVSLGAFLLQALIGVFLRLGLFDRLVGWLQRLPLARLRPSESVREGARNVDRQIRDFATHHRRDFLLSTFWLTMGRAFAVAEVWVILWRLGLPTSPAVTGMVFAMTALANYMLMVLPAREGFLEGSTYVIFGLIGMNPADGLSLEIIRRIRKIAYQGLGLGLTLALTREGRKPAQAEAAPKEAP